MDTALQRAPCPWGPCRSLRSAHADARPREPPERPAAQPTPGGTPPLGECAAEHCDYGGERHGVAAAIGGYGHRPMPSSFARARCPGSHAKGRTPQLGSLPPADRLFAVVASASCTGGIAGSPPCDQPSPTAAVRCAWRRFGHWRRRCSAPVYFCSSFFSTGHTGVEGQSSSGGGVFCERPA